MSYEPVSSTAIEVEPCPGCGTTHGVQPEPALPKVAAWTCTACGMSWAVTVVNPSPQPYFDRLAAAVEQLGAARSTLRQVIALADDSATLSAEELRNRLAALAEGHLATDHHAVVDYGRGTGTQSIDCAAVRGYPDIRPREPGSAGPEVAFLPRNTNGRQRPQ